MPTEKETHTQSDTEDRAQSSGNKFGHEQNKSAEGNDPSLTEGGAITRTVPSQD